MELRVRLPGATREAVVDIRGFACQVLVQGAVVLTVPLPLRVATATARLCQQGGDTHALLAIAMEPAFVFGQKAA